MRVSRIAFDFLPGIVPLSDWPTAVQGALLPQQECPYTNTHVRKRPGRRPIGWSRSTTPATVPVGWSVGDHRQRSKRLRGITTTKFRHARAGKQARVGDHPAELRSCIEATSVVAESKQTRVQAPSPRHPEFFCGHFLQPTKNRRRTVAGLAVTAARYRGIDTGGLPVVPPDTVEFWSCVGRILAGCGFPMVVGAGRPAPRQRRALRTRDHQPHPTHQGPPTAPAPFTRNNNRGFTARNGWQASTLR
jgi:hypothetical protein